MTETSDRLTDAAPAKIGGSPASLAPYDTARPTVAAGNRLDNTPDHEAARQNAKCALTAIRDRLEDEFALMLDRDLAANGADRVHIVLVSETDLQTCGEFVGLTSPHIHRWLSCYVPDWRGPAPAMLIDDDVLRRESGGNEPDQKTAFVGVAVHEAAHIVCTPGLFARDDHQPDIGGGFDQRFFADAIKTPMRVRSPELARRSVRHGHETPFLRAALHIRHRLQRRGVGCPMPEILNPDHHQISRLWVYLRALGDEPDRLAGVPLSMIQHIEPPTAFLDVWQRDSTTWQDD